MSGLGELLSTDWRALGFESLTDFLEANADLRGLDRHGRALVNSALVDAGFTQKEAGRLTGVDQATVSRDLRYACTAVASPEEIRQATVKAQQDKITKLEKRLEDARLTLAHLESGPWYWDENDPGDGMAAFEAVVLAGLMPSVSTPQGKLAGHLLSTAYPRLVLGTKENGEPGLVDPAERGQEDPPPPKLRAVR